MAKVKRTGNAKCTEDIGEEGTHTLLAKVQVDTPGSFRETGSISLSRTRMPAVTQMFHCSADTQPSCRPMPPKTNTLVFPEALFLTLKT